MHVFRAQVAGHNQHRVAEIHHATLSIRQAPILDDGRLTDGQGRVVDFRNTVLIMTSNLGTEYVHKGGTLGFLQRADTDEERQAHEKIEKALKSAFRPEFLNRIDEIIMFSPLTIDNMREIVLLQMKEVEGRLQEHGLKVVLTPAGQEWLAQAGYDTTFGARPLRRAIQKYIESPLSIKLFAGEFVSTHTVVVDVENETNVFHNNDEAPAEVVSQPEVTSAL